MKTILVSAVFAILVLCLQACGGSAVGSDSDASPVVEPAAFVPVAPRDLDVSCPRGTYSSTEGVTFVVECDGAPVTTGLRCGGVTQIPADVACTVQPMREGAKIGDSYPVAAGSGSVNVRVVLP